MSKPSEVESAISAILKPVAEVFSVVARRVDGNDGIMLNPNEVFPSASVIKVPMMVDLFCLRDEGRLSFDEVVTLRAEYKVEGSGALKELHAGLELTVLDLIILMIVQSDNTAANMLIDRIGMESVNERMRGFGFEKMTLARRMYEWEAQAKGFENVCTPSEIATLLESMLEGSISSMSTSTEMLEIMARQQWRERIPLLLPEGTKVANKTGSITGVTHDVGVVYGPSGPYVLCVMTKGVSDVISAERAIAEVSKLAYEFYCS